MPAPAIISSVSRLSAGIELLALGLQFSSGAWVAANRAIRVPLYLPRPATVKKLWWANGSAVSGNVDCGIYRASDKARITSTGSVAQTGTSALQEVDITDLELPAGVYLMSLVLDNGTGQIMRNAGSLPTFRLAGVTQEASAFPSPATATPAALATAYFPLFGVSLRTLVA